MFKQLIWGTDGSESADQALALAKTLAAEGGGEMLVVHCEELTLPSKLGGVPLHVDEDELKAKIQAQVADLKSAGIQAALEMPRGRGGSAAHAIAEAAEARQADLIVIGTRGQTRLGGLLLGSVAQRLLLIAPCPVLTVPLRATAQDE